MLKAIHYCYQMYLRSLEIRVLKYTNLILQHLAHLIKFLSAPGLAWQASLKKTKEKLDLLTDIVMLLMVEKGIRICHLFIDIQ